MHAHAADHLPAKQPEVAQVPPKSAIREPTCDEGLDEWLHRLDDSLPVWDILV
jgi:hypothetical protein